MKYFKLFAHVDSYVCMKVGSSVLMWEIGCAHVHPQIKNLNDIRHLINPMNEITKDQFNKEMGEIVAAGHLIDAGDKAGSEAYKLLGVTMCVSNSHNSMKAHPAFKSFFEQVKFEQSLVTDLPKEIPMENK